MIVHSAAIIDEKIILTRLLKYALFHTLPISESYVLLANIPSELYTIFMQTMEICQYLYEPDSYWFLSHHPQVVLAFWEHLHSHISKCSTSV